LYCLCEAAAAAAAAAAAVSIYIVCEICKLLWVGGSPLRSFMKLCWLRGEKNGAVWMDSHDASAFFPCSWSFMVDSHPPWGWCCYALMGKMELLGVGMLL
jgi:hypothetical protein